MVEQLLKSTDDVHSSMQRLPEITNLSQINYSQYRKVSTKIDEFDRCLGGGIVLGSVCLLSGEPGIGKSTLLTQLALNFDKTLYVAGEESAQQIKLRAERIKPKANLAIINETDVDVISGTIEQFIPDLVIVDSIQTLQTSDLDSAAGTIAQVRECAFRLQKMAKRLNIPIFLVGHITKEGSLAGPKALEHLVDVVLNLEGEALGEFRILRCSKNRFGPTDEVGIFEMDEAGMKEVENPSKLFLTNFKAPGSAVAVILAGQRPILLEIQSLVTKSSLPYPKRTGVGIDNNRLQLLVAVLQKRINLPLFDQDIFINITGGLRVFEPAIDLGICMAIVSSHKGVAIAPKTAFVGEVGLLGEVRGVRFLEKRIKEAKKLLFNNIISLENAKSLFEATKLAQL